MRGRQGERLQGERLPPGGPEGEGEGPALGREAEVQPRSGQRMKDGDETVGETAGQQLEEGGQLMEHKGKGWWKPCPRHPIQKRFRFRKRAWLLHHLQRPQTRRRGRSEAGNHRR